MNFALTVAGSDTSGGAGIQADIKTFRAFGVRDLSLITALTAQNTIGIQDIFEVPSEFIASQLDAIVSDIRPDALKTGMLYSEAAVTTVASKIKDYGLKNLVIDPVVSSTTGTVLTNRQAMEALKNELLPLCSVVTPNLKEASVLAQMAVDDVEGMKKAASVIMKFGPGAVIVTGGHLLRQPVDILCNGKEFIVLEGKRITGWFHGTGCVFSAALTASLAKGSSLALAFNEAKEFVQKAIENSLQTVSPGLKLLGI